MRWIFILFMTFWAQQAAAEHAEAFDAFAPFVGKTWYGAEAVEDSKHGTVIQRWDWILGGRALRITHANNGGAFGGEWTIYTDPETGELQSNYISTSGSVAKGKLIVMDGVMIHETPVKGSDRLDLVRVTYTPQEDGSFITRSEYFLKGEPLSGEPVFHFHEAPQAELYIKPVER